MEPVIYCVMACLAALEGLPHLTLARQAQVSVVSLDSATLQQLHQRAHSPPILYYSPQAYREAMSQLPAAEQWRALDKRRLEWSPQALDKALSPLLEQQRQTLKLIGALRQQRPGAPSPEGWMQHLLALSADMAGRGRYEALSLAELLQMCLEMVAGLREEWQLAPARDPGGQARQLQSRLETGLAELLRQAGKPQFAQAPLQLGLDRAVWVHPRDQTLERRLRAAGEPLQAWRDGMVCRMPVARIGQLRASGLRVEVLYLDAGEWLRSTDELTPAQQDVEWGAKLQAGAPAQAAATDKHLSLLAWQQTLALAAARGAAAQATPALPGAAAPLDRMVAASLAAWLAMPAANVAPPPEKGALQALLRTQLHDLSMLHQWSQREGRSDLAARLLAWQQAMQRLVDAVGGWPDRT